MTKQESFKKRVRARMEKTGERYAAARSALLAQAAQKPGRVWVSQPETSDQAVIEATGTSWDGWCDLIDAWPGHVDGHPAIAAWVASEHGIDAWWSQAVTVGYERITGRRLPYQRADGTFTAGKSKTVGVGAGELRALLLDADSYPDLFPGHHAERRSKIDAKGIRIAIGAGTALFGLGAAGDGRTKVTIGHDGLPDLASVEEWKFYWTDWLDALDASSAP